MPPSTSLRRKSRLPDSVSADMKSHPNLVWLPAKNSPTISSVLSRGVHFVPLVAQIGGLTEYLEARKPVNALRVTSPVRTEGQKHKNRNWQKVVRPLVAAQKLT